MNQRFSFLTVFVFFRFLGTITGIYFGRFLGSEGTMPTGQLIVCGILLFFLVNILIYYNLNNKKKYSFLFLGVLFFQQMCLCGFLFYHIKIYMISAVSLWISGCLAPLYASASGGESVPHSSPPTSSSEDSFDLRVLSEPWPVTPNLGLESSIRNRISILENSDSSFLIEKPARGGYWGEIQQSLRACSAQPDYNRLIEFENRDLQIRENKYSCYLVFKEVLSQDPALAENAAYNPKEALLDFFAEKRDKIEDDLRDLKNKNFHPAERDGLEIRFVHQVEEDLRRHGSQSVYIREIFGNSDAPSPLDQFSILPLIPIQIGDLYFSFTNPSLFMVRLKRFAIRSFIVFAHFRFR